MKLLNGHRDLKFVDFHLQIDYIRAICKPKDGKLLAVGHSMGGILLYAKLSRYGKSCTFSCISCFCD